MIDKYEEIYAPIFIKNDKGDYKINTNYWTVPKAGPSLWNKHAGLYPTYEENEDLIRFICKNVDTNEDGEDYLVAKLTGRINNQKDYDEGIILCGCILAADHASELQRYIANKQIEAIRGKKIGKRISKNVSGDNWQEKVINKLNK